MHQVIAKLDTAARWHEDQARIVRRDMGRTSKTHAEQALLIREAILELQGGVPVDENQAILPL